MSKSAVTERIQRCQCDACVSIEHASWCAVHNAPALPIGECTCSARRLRDLSDADIIKHHGVP